MDGDDSDLDDAPGRDEGDGVVEVVLDEAAAAAIEETRALLARASVAVDAAALGGEPAPALAAALAAASRGGLALGASATGGARAAVAARPFAVGDVVLDERAAAFFLARSPGTDAVYALTARARGGGPPAGADAAAVGSPPGDSSAASDAGAGAGAGAGAEPRGGAGAGAGAGAGDAGDADDGGVIVAVLPQWAALRTLRDSFTLCPPFAGGRAEAAYALLTQLTAFGSTAHGAWEAAHALPNGVPGETRDGAPNDVPPRAQLLAAIAQCNAFAVRLPVEEEGGGGGAGEEEGGAAGDDGAPAAAAGGAAPAADEGGAGGAGGPGGWRAALLWPLLGRLASPGDRERLFDDPEPLAFATGFFPAGACLNHACAPNASFGECAWAAGEPAPRLVVRAARDIAQGEEVTINYVGGGAPGAPGAGAGAGGEGAGEGADSGAGGAAAVAARRRALLLAYRFRCACAECARAVPGAGGAQDPLARHFPNGLGLDGTAAYFAAGRGYPREE